MDQRRRARLILILGVLLALGAAAGTFFYASSSQSAVAPAVPTTDVLVATRDIPPKTALLAADLKVAKVNADVAPPAALKDPNDAIGKVVAQAISVNEPILATKFAPPEQAFTVFPPGVSVEPGSPHYRIVQVTVPNNAASGGVIQAGDKVDIMVVFAFDPAARLTLPTPAPGATPTPAPTPTPTPLPPGASPTPRPSAQPGRIASDTIVKIIMGPIEVLARAETIYTFRMDAAMAERFAYMQAAGMALHLLVRAPGDDRVPVTTGAFFGTVYEQFKFPLPERVVP